MLGVVNAKINIGLQIVNRREDGYHDLQTIFYPIGKYAGLPDNPTHFCDILEVVKTDNSDLEINLSGRTVNCPLEKNLVYKAAKMILGEERGCKIYLDKHLPDGAGLGGGSADAAFTLRLINEAILSNRYTDENLAAMALKLGADCPFFIYNRPMYGGGVGEKLEDISLDLSGKWILVIKPDVYVSTKEAFAGIKPKPGDIDLRLLPSVPISEWQGLVKNDFENSIFPKHPILKDIKDQLISKGAQYASMSGSGSSIFGIFDNYKIARECEISFTDFPTIEGIYLLKL